MKYNVSYSTESIHDLHDLYRYIAYNLFAPQAAARRFNDITDEIAKLDSNPLRFPLYREPSTAEGLRYFSVKSHTVFYTVNEELHTVYIVRILYGKMDIKKELKK